MDTVVSIQRISQRVYFGERLEDPGYGWRKRTRLSGQQKCESTMVIRNGEVFLVNTALFYDPEFYPDNPQRRDLVTVVRVSPAGRQLIEAIDLAVANLMVPDNRDASMHRLVPWDREQAPAPEYSGMLMRYREDFPVLEPGELFDEVVGAVMQEFGFEVPKTARAYR